MTVKITISCDNAAFEECPSAEVSRILTGLAEKLFNADFNEPFDRKLVLNDYNGNVVGKLEVCRQ